MNQELILKTSSQFKFQRLFPLQIIKESSINNFYAGFGNKITDLIAYTNFGIQEDMIFIIDPESRIKNKLREETSYTKLVREIVNLFPNF